MSMAFHGIEAELAERIGVPVVNPVPATLMMAELLVRCGLSHSPLSYPPSAPPVILSARLDDTEPVAGETPDRLKTSRL
jgi:hypothetical protein